MVYLDIRFRKYYLNRDSVDNLALHALYMYSSSEIFKDDFTIEADDFLAGHRLYFLCNIKFTVGQVNQHMLVKLIYFVFFLFFLK